MIIDVLLSIEELTKADLSGKTAIIIDILRASSTLTTALGNGISKIIPVAEIQKALDLRAAEPEGTTLLGGERNMQHIPDFDYGNSPREYAAAVNLNTKTLIFSTTNGTKALIKAVEAHAAHITIGCFLNAEKSAVQALSLNCDIVLVCSGIKGRFALEDMLGAGAIINALLAITVSNPLLILSDTAKAAVRLFNTYSSPLEGLLDSIHSTRLDKLGLHEDIVFCSQLNKIPIAAIYRDNAIYLDK